jgi:hypothetical protein
MIRVLGHFYTVALVLWFALTSSPGQGLAAETRSATLRSGETTQDGELTLIVARSANARLDISLTNNDVRRVVVDTYALSNVSPFVCNGTDVAISGSGRRQLCVVSIATNVSVGHASLQLSVTWHEVAHFLRSSVPSPMPSSSGKL